ncbi:MAG TPA: hypothetical protein VLY45_02325 [Nitrospiria bacterium]|nr:hypothetical protein [Nitrospiria bacterium]
MKFSIDFITVAHTSPVGKFPGFSLPTDPKGADAGGPSLAGAELAEQRLGFAEEEAETGPVRSALSEAIHQWL